MHTSMGIMSHLQAPAFFDTVDKSPRLGGDPSLLPAITWIPPRTGAVSWPASRRRSASARARDVASRAPVACPLQTKTAKQLLRQRNIGNRIARLRRQHPNRCLNFSRGDGEFTKQGSQCVETFRSCENNGSHVVFRTAEGDRVLHGAEVNSRAAGPVDAEGGRSLLEMGEPWDHDGRELSLANSAPQEVPHVLVGGHTSKVRPG